MALEFRQVVDGYTLPNSLALNAEFYEADISVDAILSYPWMAKAQVGVFPHHNALAIDTPHLTLLYGIRKGKGGYISRRPENLYWGAEGHQGCYDPSDVNKIRTEGYCYESRKKKERKRAKNLQRQKQWAKPHGIFDIEIVNEKI